MAVEQLVVVLRPVDPFLTGDEAQEGELVHKIVDVFQVLVCADPVTDRDGHLEAEAANDLVSESREDIEELFLLSSPGSDQHHEMIAAEVHALDGQTLSLHPLHESAEAAAVLAPA